MGRVLTLRGSTFTGQLHRCFSYMLESSLYIWEIKTKLNASRLAIRQRADFFGGPICMVVCRATDDGQKDLSN